jgi:hypothetical protein
MRMTLKEKHSGRSALISSLPPETIAGFALESERTGRAITAYCIVPDGTCSDEESAAEHGF